MNLLGIEIGGTKLQLVLGDEHGGIHERRRLVVDPAEGAAGIREQIERTLPELLAGRKIEATGVRLGCTGGGGGLAQAACARAARLGLP